MGLAVLSQALGRQSMLESEDYPTLAALGADRRPLVALGMARNLLVALVGAAGAVAVASVLSPMAPLGEARAAEANTGVHLDPIVLSVGALATAALVFALGLWPALRAARSVRPPPSCSGLSWPATCLGYYRRWRPGGPGPSSSCAPGDRRRCLRGFERYGRSARDLEVQELSYAGEPSPSWCRH